MLARDSEASQCSWYFVMYIITSVAAIAVVAAMMSGVECLIKHYNLTYLRSGDYGTPPSWQRWLAQLLVWGFVGITEKVLTTYVLVYPLHYELGRLAQWLEGPLRPYPHVELTIVMVIAPVLISILTVWVFDNVMNPHKRKRLRAQAHRDVSRTDFTADTGLLSAAVGVGVGAPAGSSCFDGDAGLVAPRGTTLNSSTTPSPTSSAGYLPPPPAAGGAR